MSTARDDEEATAAREDIGAPTDFQPRYIAPEDWQRFRSYVGEIFDAFGLSRDTPETRDTPERFLTAIYDSTSGYDGDPKLVTTFPTEFEARQDAFSGQIIEGPIPFCCLCEHHALPFFGVAHVGYIASDEIIGISKLTRIVRMFARRFTVQERLGEQVANMLVDLIAPQGVAVHLEATHLCTRMRGVEEHTKTVATFWRGAFRDPDHRHEFLQQVRGQSSH